jgi:4a-hydroxytetrahydrobiopterin dehydratase
MEKPKILTARELRTIMPRLSGWTLSHNKLSRTFEFQDFVQSLSFVNSLVGISRRLIIIPMCTSRTES